MAGSVCNGGTAVDWDISTDEEGNREYNVHYDCLTALGDSPAVALYASGMPVPGAAMPSDSSAIYTRRGTARLLKLEGSKKRWRCSIVYTTKPLRRCSTSSFSSPLAEPHKVGGGIKRQMREIRFDNAGNALVNSCKEPVTGIQGPDDHQTIKLEMNCSWINTTFLAAYVGAVNNNVWWGWPVRTLLCHPFSWERLLYGTCYKYYRCSFEFEIKNDTWDEWILDQGNMRKVVGSVPARYVRAQDERENTIRVLLDNAGNATTTPTWIAPKPRVKTELDFSVVGWPVTLL